MKDIRSGTFTLIVLAVLFVRPLVAKTTIQQLKKHICHISCSPFLSEKAQHAAASAISNKGNTTDLSLRELYWNTFQDEADLRKIIDTQLQDGSWPDIDYKDQARSNWQPTNHVSNLLYLSRAYITSSSVYYHREDVSRIIHRGINYWFAVQPVCRNWWYNEICIPRIMGQVFIFIEKELSEVEKEKAIRLMNQSGFRMTGQNKVWLAGNVLMKALLINDEQLAKAARDTIASEIYTTTSEGIQPDFSFHQHGPQQQMGNYGLAYISSMSYFANVFGNTSLAFSDHQLDVLYQYVVNGLGWVSWKGYYDVSACNRQLFKKAQQGKALALSVAANQMIKADPIHAEQYKNLIDANKVVNANIKSGSRHFWRSDLTVYRSPDYYLSVRTCSPRVIGTEFTNNENKKGHYLSDGATLLMQRGTEFEDIFPLWDWNRIPGVTALVLDTVKEQKGDDYRNKNAFVGGITANNCGITAFWLDRGKLEAQKAWFKFPKFMVCLGAGIHTSSSRQVITAVNQVYQHGEWIVNENQRGFSGVDTLLESSKIQSIWHDSVGYYFPEVQHLQLFSGLRTGNWHEIADPYPTSEVKGKLFSLSIDHGKGAQQSDNYEYALYPSVSESDFNNFTGKPTYKVLANNKELQAVELKDQSGVSFVFYRPGKCYFFDRRNYMETFNAGLIQIQSINSRQWELSIADPTQALHNFVLCLKGHFKGVGAVYNPNTNTTRLIVALPINGNAGSKVSVSVEKIDN